MDGEVKGQPTMIRIGAPSSSGEAVAPSAGGIEAAISRMEALLAKGLQVNMPEMPAPVVNVHPTPATVHIERAEIPPPVVHVEIPPFPELKPEFKIPDYKWQPNVIMPDPKILEFKPNIHVEMPEIGIGVFYGIWGIFTLGVVALWHFW